MTKRAAAAQARNKMKFVADDLELFNSDEEVSSVANYSSSESEISEGSSGEQSADPSEESENEESDKEVSDKIKIKHSRSDIIGFESFDHITVLQDNAMKLEEKENHMSPIAFSHITNEIEKLTQSDLEKVTQMSPDLEQILEKYTRLWLKSLDQLKVLENEDLVCIQLSKDQNDKFHCPFPACSKEFCNYNGIIYHLNKGLHSVVHWADQIKDILEETGI